MASRIGIRAAWRMRFVLAISVMASMVMGLMDPRSVQAQAKPATPLSFEVASVKASTSVDQGSSMNPSPGMFLANNVSVQLLVQAAYGVRDFQIAGGPSWITTEKFDVEAKAARNVPVAQLMSMLHTMLEDRFKLKAHRESRELPVYLLTFAKGGLKIQPSNCTPSDPASPDTDSKRCDQMRYGRRGSNRTIDAVGVTMGFLAASLSQTFGRTVLDRTALSDPFDFHLEWLPESVQERDSRDDPANPQGGSIFSALQEQLGLKVESSKGPVEVLVVDHVERPSEN
jgi:uncharacterized protein (TIGR03435 family)